MTREYFRHGIYVVTNVSVQALNKSIQLDTIEGVSVARPLFFMSAGVAVGLLGLGLLYADLLWLHEIAFSLLLGGALLWASWLVGTLRVYSKLTGEKGWSMIGPFATLQQMRGAIERAISDQNRFARRTSETYVNSDEA